ncbi:MAG: hypothetical protein QOG63_3118 [Thermoleophilaceae bacterium]|nr:hypothetical protein [Thermoleophilaceae bacterium]
MLRALLASAAVCCALAAGTAQAQAPADTCNGTSPSAAPCTGAVKLADAAAAECRRLGRPESDCNIPLSHEVAADVADAYRKTWLHRAAAFQYRLGRREPLADAQWLGTHNSFNSVNESPTASHTDSNQQLSLTQQLDVDMRSIELDLHYVGGTVLVCHGRGPDEGNLGCTNEPPFAELLPKVKDWLDDHPKQVVLLYLEDELGDPAGYAQSVSVLDDVLGPKILRPSPSEMTSKGCANLPLDVSRGDALSRGAQVILVGNCRSGWAADVYSWDDNHAESGSTPDYRPFPACDATYDRGVYDSKLIRYFEDSTFVSTAVDPSQTPAQQEADSLTPARVASMTRCGVNLFGLDQLLPDDGRIEASIWSWAKGEPTAKGGRCALQRADGRWLARACGQRHVAGCRAATGWALTPKAVRHASAARACRALGARFGVPRTGYENSQLRALAGDRRVWLRYALR